MNCSRMRGMLFLLIELPDRFLNSRGKEKRVEITFLQEWSRLSANNEEQVGEFSFPRWNRDAACFKM